MTKIKMVHLGNTGLVVSNLCLGTMTFGVQTNKETAFEILDKAFNAGINFIDTADVYPIGRESFKEAGITETYIGEWLKDKREKIVLATKCYGVMGDQPNDKGLGRVHIMNAIDASLKRLQTSYIDLYLAHQFDNETPIEETLKAFDDIITLGKARYVGISNWRAWQIVKANGIACLKNYSKFVCVEPRYNLLFRMIEEDLIPMCLEEGLGIISYNPLAGGLLTGKYPKESQPIEGTRFGLAAQTGALYQKRYWQTAQFEAVEKYRIWCEDNKLDMTTTAVKWVMQQKGITSVIVGASKPEQLDASLRATEVDDLTDDQLQWLDQLWFSLPRRYEFS